MSICSLQDHLPILTWTCSLLNSSSMLRLPANGKKKHHMNGGRGKEGGRHLVNIPQKTFFNKCFGVGLPKQQLASTRCFNHVHLLFYGGDGVGSGKLEVENC